MKINGTVLCFNFEDEKYKKIEKVCAKAKMRARRPDLEDYSKPVGELVGFSGITSSEGPSEFSDEMMLISSFSSGELNRFLKAMHAEGVEVPLKASLTETNKSWTPAALCEELKKEHEQMQKNSAG